jgi:hypothetical protein
MNFSRKLTPRQRNRRGLTTPAVALALLIAMAGLAMIIDRAWLESAQLELTTAAETTALAAARQLVQDDRLIPSSLEPQRLDAARTAAEMAAVSNPVAGHTPSFDPSGNDILFGSYSQPQADGTIVFQTDVPDPNTVRITLHRSRARNNPVALFIGRLTGVPFGNVVRQADATINNQVEGLRPVSGAYAPMLPLAIWKADPSGSRQDTWDAQIEQRRGLDNYSFDSSSNQPVAGSDGIPEIIIRSLPRGGRPELCNMQVVDLGSELDDTILARQFQSGISVDDLQDLGGVLSLAANLTLSSSPELRNSDRDAVDTILGQPRICLLYSTSVPNGQNSLLQTTCVAFVAVRVMAVLDQSDGSCTLVLQPTVIATRSALVTTAVGQTSTFAPNKYIYNLKLTN